MGIIINTKNLAHFCLSHLFVEHLLHAGITNVNKAKCEGDDMSYAFELNIISF